MSRSRNARVGMTLALAAAIAGGGALAFVNSHAPRTSVSAESASSAVPPAELGVAEADAPEADAAALSGSVLETLPVSKYTYLRLATSQGEVWAAVPSASIAVGSRVAIADANRMENFKSSTLNRTFGVIYFGTLTSAPATPRASAKHQFSPLDVLSQDEQDLPAGHPPIDGESSPPAVANGDALPPGHPDISGAPPAAALNGSAKGKTPSAPAVPVAPATGSNAHVISELTSLRQKLAGQRVRVRGQVVKVTPHIQGHTFFHLRDSSLGSEGQAADLVVTSDLEPQVGQVAVFEGTLRTNVDIGIGYFYPVLLENATLIAE